MIVATAAETATGPSKDGSRETRPILRLSIFYPPFLLYLILVGHLRHGTFILHCTSARRLHSSHKRCEVYEIFPSKDHTELRKSLCTWFGEVCSCCCLPLLPQLACNILATTYKDFFSAFMYSLSRGYLALRSQIEIQARNTQLT